jgi:hypothetical protein
MKVSVPPPVQTPGHLLVMWVVYDHPKDFPDRYVARRFENGEPTEVILEAQSHAELQVLLAWNYPHLRYFRRHYWDDPVIMEMWA